MQYEKNIYENSNDLKVLLKAGDEQAYKFIYDKYARHMFIFGCQFTDNREDIFDAIHDAFISLYKHRDRLDGIITIKSYLLRSLKNGLLNSWKRKKIFNDKFLSHSENINSNDNPESLIIDKENDISRNTILSTMMKQLTPNQREAIFYRYIENMTIEEIALIMSINYQSVMNLLQRSLKKAKKYFEANSNILKQ